MLNRIEKKADELLLRRQAGFIITEQHFDIMSPNIDHHQDVFNNVIVCGKKDYCKY